VNGLTAMLVLAAVCWLFRIVFIVLVPAHRLPPVVRRALGHLAPSVLAALVAVETQASARQGSTVTGLYVVCSVVVMALVVRRTHSLLGAIGVGAAAAVLLDLVILR
jgi:branched-subunit amino acid transport protein